MNLCFICVHLWRPALGNACYNDPEISPSLYSDLCCDRPYWAGSGVYGARHQRVAGTAAAAGFRGNLHRALRRSRLYVSRENYFCRARNYRGGFSGRRGLILLGLAGRELLSLVPADRGASDDFGVVPLGMPLIAGPALLTALLILVDTVGLVFTLVSLLINLGLVAIAFWNADRVTRWMGRQGLRGVSKIVALLLAAIAVSLIRRGWHGA